MSRNVNHDMPSQGFTTSTIFTLGTEHGVILCRMHTEGDNLFFFGTFVQRGHFDINMHWTTWRPRNSGEAIDIDHEAISVPVDNVDPILHLPVEYQELNIRSVQPNNPHRRPQQHRRHATHYVIPSSSESSDEESLITQQRPLRTTNPDPEEG